jgi:hypothetical protein
MTTLVKHKGRQEILHLQIFIMANLNMSNHLNLLEYNQSQHLGKY